MSILESVPSELISCAGEADMSINAETWQGLRCLHLAALGGQPEVISFLLDHRFAEVDDATENELLTSLHIAAYQGNLSLAKLLLEAGVSVNQKSARGETAFDIALQKSNAGMMNLLIESGANILNDNKSAIWIEVVGWSNVTVRAVLQSVFKNIPYTSRS
jgi:ankyrin repeat protein